jgi:dihydrofolate synthase / folylpolyglutamate synthase
MADHASSSDPVVQAQLDRFAQLSPGRDILGLERISALMAALGNPHKNLPPVFHVAGTNGKGSTCAFLLAAIEAAGKTAHVYTSPHLVRFNERIRVAGKLIEDASLALLLAEVLDAAQAQDIGSSFFEVTTAAAFLAFARSPADACIIEVGLGGRLDATNIIKAPAVCGIASLGIDHEAFLLEPEDGTPDDPLTRIGWEKAGIAKNGVPLVMQHYPEKVTVTIAAHAAKIGAPLIARKTDWDGLGWGAGVYDGKIAYRDAQGSLKLPLPRMAGSHQVDNAALAIAMLRHQSAISIPESAMAAAMEWAHWPARLQALGNGPLKALLPKGTEIWLDGGHNVDAGLALARHFAGNEKRIHLIIGMLANKDPAAIIAPLADRIASITILPIPGHEHHKPEAFVGLLPIPAVGAPDITSALSALGIDPIKDAVLIAGSLYLAGVVLAQNGEVPV